MRAGLSSCRCLGIVNLTRIKLSRLKSAPSLDPYSCDKAGITPFLVAADCQT